MLNRIAAAVRLWRPRPRYQHPQLLKAQQQCNREIVRIIRDFERLRRGIHTTTDVARLMKLQHAIAQALVSARPGDPDQTVRQQVYLRALRTLPNVSIHYGHFLSHEITMPRVPVPGRRQEYVQVIKTEEVLT